LTSVVKEITCGIAAAGVFLGFQFGLGVFWVISGVFGVATYVGLRYTLAGSKPVDQVVDGVDRNAWKGTLAKADEVAKHIRGLVKDHRKTAITLKIEAMAKSLNQIHDRLREEPEIHPRVQFFIDNKVAEVVPVLERYLNLASRENKGARVLEQLAKSEKVIPLIAEKFDEHYQNLLAHDLVAFDVATETMASILGIDDLEYRKLEEHE